MKLLIVGSDKVYAIENFYSKYLRESGVEVGMFCAYNLFLDYYNNGLVNKLIFKSGLSSIFIKISAKFLQKVDESSPDLIWVFKGMEISPSALRRVSEKGIPLVNYNPDNPFIFSGKGSGNKNITNSISLYDLHLTYHEGVQRILKEKYTLKAEILPFGFDDDPAIYEECKKQEEVLKACFLGNPDTARAAFIQSLAAGGIPIDIYGNDWAEFLKPDPNIRLFDPQYGIEQWKVLYRYRVQLNLMRIHNTDSHNMRSFEVPGIGGIMVAPDTPEHRKFFEAGSEIFLYQTVEDCIKIMRDLLEKPAEGASLIRQAARNRSLTSGYSYRDRAALALGYLKVLMQSGRRVGAK